MIKIKHILKPVVFPGVSIYTEHPNSSRLSVCQIINNISHDRTEQNYIFKEFCIGKKYTSKTIFQLRVKTYPAQLLLKSGYGDRLFIVDDCYFYKVYILNTFEMYVVIKNVKT